MNLSATNALSFVYCTLINYALIYHYVHRSLYNIYIYILFLYINQQNRSFLCELLNGSRRHIFDVTIITISALWFDDCNFKHEHPDIYDLMLNMSYILLEQIIQMLIILNDLPISKKMCTFISQSFDYQSNRTDKTHEISIIALLLIKWVNKINKYALP